MATLAPHARPSTTAWAPGSPSPSRRSSDAPSLGSHRRASAPDRGVRASRDPLNALALLSGSLLPSGNRSLIQPEGVDHCLAWTARGPLRHDEDDEVALLPSSLHHRSSPRAARPPAGFPCVSFSLLPVTHHMALFLAEPSPFGHKNWDASIGVLVFFIHHRTPMDVHLFPRKRLPIHQRGESYLRPDRN